MGYNTLMLFCFLPSICFCLVVCQSHIIIKNDYVGGNEYGQCGEEPLKDEMGRPFRRDIVIPKRCAPKLTVRQVKPTRVFFLKYLCHFLNVFVCG